MRAIISFLDNLRQERKKQGTIEKIVKLDDDK